MGTLEEPLLNGVSNPHCKAKGCDTVTPYTNASLLRTLTFSWITPVLALGHKKSLDLNDIPLLNSSNSVFTAFPVLQNKLGSYQAGDSKISGFRLAAALYLTAWKEILWTALLAVIYAVSQYVCPFFLDDFLKCLKGGPELKNQGYILALAFTCATFLESLIRRHWIFRLQQVGIRFRASTSALIYSKGMKLPLQKKQGEDDGDYVNLLSVDVEKIYSFTVSLHDCWLILVQVSLGLLILYKNLGPASITALVATICVMLSSSGVGALQEKFQGKLMKSKDSRMKNTMETLRNMKTLKLQGWEMSFLSKLFRIRKVETQWLRQYLYSSALLNFVFGICTTVVALVTFGSCVFMGIPLETGKILSSIATFRVLKEPIYWLPNTISSLIQVKVALARIASFLCLEQLRADTLQRLPLGHSDTVIDINDGNFVWDMSSPSLTLKNIHLKVSNGMRVAICGKVGSGKSSLLSCILGEMPKISGGVILRGSTAYVAQTPWIQSGTIQENILLGKEVDLERYDKVLEACCLKMDMEVLSFGDQTVIGERGINLSGGQKQRIQIARALYHDADIYIFDDPFSAVDAHTGAHIFKEALINILREKTVVYVTHQIEFLDGADLVLVMKDGRIEQAGKYNEILVPGSDFAELVGAQRAALTSTARLASDSEPHMKTDDKISIKGNEVVQNAEEDGKTILPSEQIIQEEKREKGSVGLSVYWKYMTTGYTAPLILLMFVAIIVSEILRIGGNYWLAGASPISKDVNPAVDGYKLIRVYAFLALGISVSSLAVDMLVATVGNTSATTFFRIMHQCIFRAPMCFFDATPTGRILSRCSADQSALETDTPSLIEGVSSNVIRILGIIAVMSTVGWQILIIFIPIVFACIWYQRFYIPSSREFSRLRGVYEAPVVQYFSETISGATTIRSFGLQTSFQVTYMKILDMYCKPGFYAAAAMKWLLLRLDAFASTTFAFLLVLLLYFAGRIDPAIAGVALTYGLTVSNALTGLVWCSSHCETKMISVERIFQYTSIPSEGPLVIEENRPDSSWPSNGEICLDNLQVRYAPHMPLVLHGLTCTFPGRMKTGIAGRTGSGKSTLVQILFRIIEPTTGQILIDGIDISRIGLHDVRSKLGIIPQDPIMFQGTIRSNLDPLEQYSDEQIWETLDKCQLGDQVRKMGRKLDAEVNENGENWSMGQRQLVCLGRVLLKRSKVLVLDEATASVDTTTDNLIQQTLKQHFADSTIISIAHRVTSVIDSDLVLLLNQGRIEEFDSPKRLLENKSSSFAQLVNAWSSSQCHFKMSSQ